MTGMTGIIKVTGINKMARMTGLIEITRTTGMTGFIKMYWDDWDD